MKHRVDNKHTLDSNPGMGIAGIQIAKLFNCDVIATAGNKEKMGKCLQLGADFVVTSSIYFTNSLQFRSTN